MVLAHTSKVCAGKFSSHINNKFQMDLKKHLSVKKNNRNLKSRKSIQPGAEGYHLNLGSSVTI